MTELVSALASERRDADVQSAMLVEKLRQADGINVELEFGEISTLVADSLPTAILNEQRFSQLYGRNGENFNPVLFQPVDTVLVKTADGVKALLLDGMHRSSGAAMFSRFIERAHPDFRFVARNLTPMYLDAGYGSRDGEEDGHGVLSMADYLRLVVPPTMEQEKIAPQRVAAHLLVGWQGLVGRDVATRFSALAAFTVLNYRTVDLSDRQSVAAAVNTAWFYEGASRDEIIAIRDGLRSVAEIINQTKLPPRRIAEQVVRQVAKRADSIGGVEGTVAQLNGLLNHPVIVAKIMEHAGHVPAQAADYGLELREKIADAALNPVSPNIFSAYLDVLLDPNVGYDKMLSVFASRRPLETYTVLKASLDLEQVQAAYQKQVERDRLTVSETRLLDVFRSVINGDPASVSEALENVRRIASVMDAASTLAVVVASSPDNPLYFRQSEMRNRLEVYFAKVYKADDLVSAGTVAHQLAAYHKECLSFIGGEGTDDELGFAPPLPGDLPVAVHQSARRRRVGHQPVKLSYAKAAATPERKVRRAISAMLGALAAGDVTVLDERTWSQWEELAAAMQELRQGQV